MNPFHGRGGEAGDRTEIQRAISLLAGHGGVVELRILHAEKAGTVSGYFDSEHWQALAEEAFRWSGLAPAVYVTLNPVHRDLMARASNRAKPFAKETTADADILRRFWFMIDFDPKRPSGISATDAEHQAAIDLAIQCRDWLMAMGFPASIVADSGNGAHLLFRCDLPNEPAITELFKRCLGAIAAKWDNAAVTVDRKVYNAARIWKLYGTAAAKGDNLPERPHRVARILEVPERLDVVPRETFDALAGMAAKAAPTARAGRGSDADFERTLRPVQTALDLRQWLAHHKVPVDDGRDWQGGRLYVVNPCPWNPEHTNKSTSSSSMWTAASRPDATTIAVRTKDGRNSAITTNPAGGKSRANCTQSRPLKTRPVSRVCASKGFGLTLTGRPSASTTANGSSGSIRPTAWFPNRN